MKFELFVASRYLRAHRRRPVITGTSIAGVASTMVRLFALVLFCVLMAVCGGAASETCMITTAITPPNATADHNAAAPGNEVQFSLSSSVKGNCPLIPDSIGAWSTSDSVNTTISNQAPTQGLATCLNATPTPATISNSSTIRGHAFPSATLVCK